MSRDPKRVSTGATVLVIGLIVLMIAATGLLIYLCLNMVKGPTASVQRPDPALLPTEAAVQSTLPEETAPPTTEPEPEPEHVISTATVATVGDLLMHKPVFDTCRVDGGFDFTYLFRYTKDLSAGFDCMVGNLETTFGGDNYVYQGNPAFNCPDPLIDAVADAGYDLLLTANNHAGDTMGDGILRTIDVIRDRGLTALGSQKEGEPRYHIADINGIRVGMVCYTWAFSGDGSKFSLNGLNPVSDVGQMNYFPQNNPEKLYNEVTEIMAEMKQQGAEITMLFIHWGQEYQLTENGTQDKMAQRLCDIGFDVIVGGHPHVVQPVALLTGSEDPGHKTVCIYSLGNFVSNQRLGNISQIGTAHTEDGALFTVTFEKYSDGRVYVAAADVIPTWVSMHQNEGPRRYDILPLVKDQEDGWQDSFSLTDVQLNAARRSYDRTLAIVGDGLEECRSYLDQAKLDREQYYYDLAYGLIEEPLSLAATAPPEEAAA